MPGVYTNITNFQHDSYRFYWCQARPYWPTVRCLVVILRSHCRLAWLFAVERDEKSSAKREKIKVTKSRNFFGNIPKMDKWTSGILMPYLRKFSYAVCVQKNLFQGPCIPHNIVRYRLKIAVSPVNPFHLAIARLEYGDTLKHGTDYPLGHFGQHVTELKKAEKSQWGRN